jgi:hypothetical protein
MQRDKSCKPDHGHIEREEFEWWMMAGEQKEFERKLLVEFDH